MPISMLEIQVAKAGTRRDVSEALEQALEGVIQKRAESLSKICPEAPEQEVRTVALEMAELACVEFFAKKKAEVSTTQSPLTVERLSGS